jgi:hypothetical protein
VVFAVPPEPWRTSNEQLVSKMMGGVRTVSAGILSGCKSSPPMWSLLVWDGYGDPSFIQGLEAQCQVSKV